jgi:hypothetical protein
MRRKSRLLVAALAVAMLASAVPAGAAAKKSVPKPTYPPQEGEFYPISNKAYPEKVANPSAHTRVASFSGKPLDIFTQIDMVTQLVFPAPPLLVNIGRPEGYVVEVIPEFNAIFLKPRAEVEMTNLIVTTAQGTYTFILKESPWKPWDIRVQVIDPYRNVKAADPYTLTWMAYYGKRPAEMQFVPIDMRTPNATTYVYDPLSKMGCRMALRRAVNLPRSGKSIYWLEFQNVLPPDVREGQSAGSYAIDERGVWARGLESVILPNPGNASLPIMGKGDRVHMFLVVKESAIPASLTVRFMLHGSRQLPIQAVFKTGDANALRPMDTTDQRLTDMYNKMVENGTIQPGTAPVQAVPAAGTQDAGQVAPPEPGVPAPAPDQTASGSTQGSGQQALPPDAVVFPAIRTQP